MIDPGRKQETGTPKSVAAHESDSGLAGTTAASGRSNGEVEAGVAPGEQQDASLAATPKVGEARTAAHVCEFGHMYCEGGEACREQRRHAAEGLVIGLTGKPMELCDGMDGPFPCSKSKGHPGPHYFYNP